MTSRTLLRMGLVALAMVSGPLARSALAGPSVLVDFNTGKVLEQQQATQKWFPASLTKLMTLYVTLTALKEHRVSLDTPFVVSDYAASMPPSNMGFKPGMEVTLDNALKMMMVHSANDLAVVIAEGLDGSVAKFADEMNATAAKLGLKDSHFDNPNGLPDPNHYSSARDLATIAVALYRDFPQFASLYDIGAFRLGNRVIPTHNNILGRYPGIEGMKTGYTCAAGFNVAISDKRHGRTLILVILGSPNVRARTMKAGELLDAAFEGRFDATAAPSLASLPTTEGAPPDMHPLVCGPHRPRIAVDEMPPIPPAPPGAGTGIAPAAAEIYATRPPHFNPISVFVGPKPDWTGPVAEATAGPPPLPLSSYNFWNTGEPDPNAPKARRIVARHPHPHGHVRRFLARRAAERAREARRERHEHEAVGLRGKQRRKAASAARTSGKQAARGD